MSCHQPRACPCAYDLPSISDERGGYLLGIASRPCGHSDNRILTASLTVAPFRHAQSSTNTPGVAQQGSTGRTAIGSSARCLPLPIEGACVSHHGVTAGNQQGLECPLGSKLRRPNGRSLEVGFQGLSRCSAARSCLLLPHRVQFAPGKVGTGPLPSAQGARRQCCIFGPPCKFHWMEHGWNWHRIRNEPLEESRS